MAYDAAETCTSTPRLARFAALAELESAIRQALRETHRPEPDFRHTAAAARTITDFGGDLGAAVAGSREHCNTPSTYANGTFVLRDYAAALAEIAAPQKLVDRLYADMVRLDGESEAADERADAEFERAARHVSPQTRADIEKTAYGIRRSAANYNAQAREAERHWHAAKRAAATLLQAAA